MLYPVLLGVWAALCAASAIAALKLKPELLAKVEKLPRATIPGAILGFIDLLWCIPNAEPILPEAFHVYLLPAAIILGILAWFFLDKLFARALGGLLILLAHYFHKESFADAMPAGMLFAILCFVFGTWGIFVSGKPHLMRDLLRKLCANQNWRIAVASLLGAYAVTSLIALSFHLLSTGHSA